MTKRQKFFSAFGQFLKNLFTKNIPLKVTALLFAVLLWGYVLGIENPTYVKRVRDVEITFTGEDSLNARGLMLVPGEKMTTDVDVECEVSKHSDLDASRVTCTVDLSDREISLDPDEDTKTITRAVMARVASGYGTVQGMSLSSVDLTIARVSSRSGIRVEVETQNQLPDGFMFYPPENLTVTVRGQKSKLDRIAYGTVNIDLLTFWSDNREIIDGFYNLVLPVVFWDASNNVLSDIVTSSGERVTASVQVTIRAYKDVPIVPRVETTEAFDRYFTYTCIPSQQTVRIFGSPSVLEKIDRIETDTIFPNDEVGEERMTVNLSIPDGVTLDASQNSEMVMLVSVAERIAEAADYSIKINYSGIGYGLQMSGDEPEFMTVSVTGSVKAMEKFNADWIKLQVNLSDWNEETELYPVQLTFLGTPDLYDIRLSSDTVKVVLTPTENNDSAGG